MPSFPFGNTPAAIIRKTVAAQCPDGYPMTIRSQSDWTIIAEAWNQGIDSHLEALTTRSSADASTGQVNIHPDELHVFLRRLLESESDEAWALRSDILSTLDIHED
jgi:hypothetical protein